MKIHHIIIFFIALAVPVSLINFQAYLKGSMPNMFQAISTLVFILLWFLCTFYWDRMKIGLRAATWFWGCGSLWLLLAIVVKVDLISILAVFMIAGPLYGLRYFIEMPSDFYFAFLCIAIAYSVSVLGWLMSKLKNRS